MKLVSRTLCVLGMMGCLIFINIGTATAGIDLPWSTTFNCPDWTQGGSFSCDGIYIQKPEAYNSCCNAYLSNNTDFCSNHPGAGTLPSVLDASANNPIGGGGKAYRVSVGDGVNNNGANPYVMLNTPQGEMWIRWYMKYPAGFAWTYLNYHKLLYFWQAGIQNTAIVQMLDTSISLYDQVHWIWEYPTANFGFSGIMNGPTGDGKWHAYEVHVKKDTNGANGVYQVWVDGTLRNSHSDVNWSGLDFTAVFFNVNQAYPNNGGCVYIDYDDITISNTGYIGPIAGVRPSAPVLQ